MEKLSSYRKVSAVAQSLKGNFVELSLREVEGREAQGISSRVSWGFFPTPCYSRSGASEDDVPTFGLRWRDHQLYTFLQLADTVNIQNAQV